jgi:hypothetical protein
MSVSQFETELRARLRTYLHERAIDRAHVRRDTAHMTDTHNTTQLDAEVTCPKCNQLITFEQLCVMDWSGRATEHIHCPSVGCTFVPYRTRV